MIEKSKTYKIEIKMKPAPMKITYRKSELLQ